MPTIETFTVLSLKQKAGPEPCLVQNLQFGCYTHYNKPAKFRGYFSSLRASSWATGPKSSGETSKIRFQYVIIPTKLLKKLYIFCRMLEDERNAPLAGA
jgi:hypothetical protein